MFFETFLQSRLPLTLGRDFAGVVRAVGVKVHHVKAGDEVMGVVPPHCCTGSHALFVAVPAQFVVLKPAHLSMVEAAALPNAGLVAWTALRTHGQLMAGRGKCVLVIGASGGVGSIVVQLAKTWGSKVLHHFKLSFLSLFLKFLVDQGGRNLLLGCHSARQISWCGSCHRLPIRGR